MDVRMPDGTIIRNVPEGITQSELSRRLGLMQGGGGLPPSTPPPSIMSQIAANQGGNVPPPEGFGALHPGVGGLAANLLSGAVAEPVAGIAGILAGLAGGADLGSRVVQGTREALTIPPGQQGSDLLQQAVGGIPEPVRNLGTAAAQGLTDISDAAAQTFGPAAGAAVRTLPTAIAEVAGLSIGRRLLKQSGQAASPRAKPKDILEAAPSQEQLKEAARGLYRELDNSGVRVKFNAYNGLVQDVTQIAQSMGLDPTLTPASTAALQRLSQNTGQVVSLSNLDTLRKVTRIAAQSQVPADAAIGAAMIQRIDDFLDNAGPQQLAGATRSAQGFQAKYRTARDLWGRARRSELITEATDKARLQASGFENGLRAQFRSLLNNRKTKKLFNESERTAMERVIQGGARENIFKLLARFGPGEGQQITSLTMLGGSAAGAAVGGAAGAVAVPLVGIVSGKMAKRMTRGNASFADAVIRSGSDATRIVQAYAMHTPKAQRSASELSELLMQPHVDISQISESIVLEGGRVIDELARKAANIARQRQAAAVAATGAVAAGQNQALGTQQGSLGL